MIDLAIRRAVRCPSFVVPLLYIVTLLCAAGMTFAAAVGDQVELNATHQAGVSSPISARKGLVRDTGHFQPQGGQSRNVDLLGRKA
jgi:hypothetical protein